MSEHREYRDELAAYALGALDTAEKLEVERHVAGCEECREYLSWLDPAVDLLPASVTPLTPPARVKRSVMSTVEGELKAERAAERDRKRTERGLWGTIWRPVTAGILSVVLVAGAVAGYLLAGNDPNSTLIEAESSAQIGAEMEVSLEVQGDQGTLHVVKLPGLPPDQDYQAWIGHNGKLQPSSTFDVREDGEVVVKGSLEGADGVYITREPEGGSEKPTRKVIMSAPLSER
ncbi:MAG: anti-sigma factor [Actinomycetota bacterium]|nr:anti-sigma factor [Actinomycetota bacterium]